MIFVDIHCVIVVNNEIFVKLIRKHATCVVDYTRVLSCMFVFFYKIKFIFQTISSAIDLRRPVYMTVCAQAFDLRQILSSMAKINWEVKEVMSQHNNYIDIVLRVSSHNTSHTIRHFDYFTSNLLSTGNSNLHHAFGANQRTSPHQRRHYVLSMGKHSAYNHAHLRTGFRRS